MKWGMEFGCCSFQSSDMLKLTVYLRPVPRGVHGIMTRAWLRWPFCFRNVCFKCLLDSDCSFNRHKATGSWVWPLTFVCGAVGKEYSHTSTFLYVLKTSIGANFTFTVDTGKFPLIVPPSINHSYKYLPKLMVFTLHQTLFGWAKERWGGRDTWHTRVWEISYILASTSEAKEIFVMRRSRRKDNIKMNIKES